MSELCSRASSMTLSADSRPSSPLGDLGPNEVIDIDDADEIIELSTAEINRLHHLQDIRSRPRQFLRTRSSFNLTLRNGDILEPQMTVECTDGSFFLIDHIVRQSGAMTTELIGNRMIRNSKFERGNAQYAPLPCQSNELYLEMRVRTGTSALLGDWDSMTSIAMSDAICVRKVFFTNTMHTNKNSAEQFFCRRKYVEEYTIEGRQKRITVRRIENLCEAEATSSKRMSDVSKSRMFRFPRSSSSNREKKRKYPASFDVDQTQPSTAPKLLQSRIRDAFRVTKVAQSVLQAPVDCKGKYNFADVFCGGGLITFAAKESGFQSHWALDLNEHACNTMRKNHPETELYELDVSDFLSILRSDKELRAKLQVDVLHISSPCQGLSPMNRGQNPEMDMKNNVLGLVVGDLIELLRPRRVTMEQTDGIRYKAGGDWLCRTIHQFTHHNYSVAWKTLQSPDYGDPVRRSRMIILASCPGETLPSFPTPTHGVGPGLNPYVTAGQRLRDFAINTNHGIVRADETKHNVEEEHRKFREGNFRSYPVADEHAPLSQTIMTQGSNLLHWSGLRRFTEREDMAFMGLPRRYLMKGACSGDRKRQTGNGVTIGLFSAICKEIIKSLKRDDVKAEAWRPPVFAIDD